MRWWPAAAIVVALAGGVAVGRYLTPPRVEVRTETRVVTRTVTETSFWTFVVTQTRTKTYTKIVEKPDGTRTTEVSTDTETGTKSSSGGDSSTVATGTTDTASVRITDARPNWRLNALGGVGFGPQAAPWLVGAQLERRLAGPLVGGGWVLSNGAQWYAGVSVGVEF